MGNKTNMGGKKVYAMFSYEYFHGRLQQGTEQKVKKYALVQAARLH